MWFSINIFDEFLNNIKTALTYKVLFYNLKIYIKQNLCNVAFFNICDNILNTLIVLKLISYGVEYLKKIFIKYC